MKKKKSGNFKNEARTKGSINNFQKYLAFQKEIEKDR